MPRSLAKLVFDCNLQLREVVALRGARNRLLTQA